MSDVRVLVVEDLPNAREWWRDFLARNGFTVETAAGWDDALRALDRTAFDVVVADLHLGRRGEADGGHVLAAAKKWHRTTRALILMTADTLGEAMAESLGVEWFDKDQDPVELVMLIRSMVARA